MRLESLLFECPDGIIALPQLRFQIPNLNRLVMATVKEQHTHLALEIAFRVGYLFVSSYVFTATTAYSFASMGRTKSEQQTRNTQATSADSLSKA